MKPEIGIGDIVILSERCRRGGELAIIVERNDWIGPNAVKIMYLNDMDTGNARRCPAIVSNLTKLETKVENEKAKK